MTLQLFIYELLIYFVWSSVEEAESRYKISSFQPSVISLEENFMNWETEHTWFISTGDDLNILTLEVMISKKTHPMFEVFCYNTLNTLYTQYFYSFAS